MAQSSNSGNSSKKQPKDYDASSSGSPRLVDPEWDVKDVSHYSKNQLLKELQEFKLKAAQMEKTMSWWSDCTANWREKWCEIRDERNKIKKDSRSLKCKLEHASKDIQTYQHENKKLESKNADLRRELERIQTLLKNSGQIDLPVTSLSADSDYNSANVSESFILHENLDNKTENFSPLEFRKLSPKDICNDLEDKISESPENVDSLENYVSRGALPKRSQEQTFEICSPIENNEQKRRSKVYNDLVNEEDYLQKISYLKERLDKATKTLYLEREEKAMMIQKMGKLKSEIVRLREKCKCLKDSQTNAMKEIVELKRHSNNKNSEYSNDMVDGSSSCDKDHRISELRAELERLQAENATEWGKREQLESEKIFLERENKQLRSELYELQERIELRRVRPTSNCDNIDSRKLQQDLYDRSKDLIDLKHSYAKIKKVLIDRTTELAHSRRRCEQYESEVKRLRARIEELKKELAFAQDEADSCNNDIRKLQHMNEDLSEQLVASCTQWEYYKNKCDKLSMISENRAPDVVAEIHDKQMNDKEQLFESII